MVPRYLLGRSACVLSAIRPLGRCTADPSHPLIPCSLLMVELGWKAIGRVHTAGHISSVVCCGQLVSGNSFLPQPRRLFHRVFLGNLQAPHCTFNSLNVSGFVFLFCGSWIPSSFICETVVLMPSIE